METGEGQVKKVFWPWKRPWKTRRGGEGSRPWREEVKWMDPIVDVRRVW
jgi:hypothetical protein